MTNLHSRALHWNANRNSWQYLHRQVLKLHGDDKVNSLQSMLYWNDSVTTSEFSFQQDVSHQSVSYLQKWIKREQRQIARKRLWIVEDGLALKTPGMPLSGTGVINARGNPVARRLKARWFMHGGVGGGGRGCVYFCVHMKVH